MFSWIETLCFSHLISCISGGGGGDADVVAIDVVTLKGIRKCESMRSTIDETGFK